MSQRSKNLLEAFNQSKAPEKSAQPVAQPRGSAPRVGGPFADQVPLVQPKPEPRAPEPRPAAADGSRSRMRVAVLCVIVAIASFFIGRVSAPGVQAADDGAKQSAGVIPSTPPGAPREAAPKSQSLREALQDPANKYSIMAIQYTQSTETERLAKATRDRLTEQGLAAELIQNPTTKKLFVLVGAAPKYTDLDGLVAKVRQATDSRGKQEFTTAFAVPIDNYLKR